MTNNAPKPDYYVTLGINKSATEAEIKKAFRTQSLKWHPDKVQRKGGSKEDLEEANRKFKEITEAYEVLSDADKRALYDKYGHQGLANGPPEDAQNDPRFAQFFQQFGGQPGGGAGGPGGPRGFHFQASRPEDIFAQFFGGGSPFGAGGAGFGDSDDESAGMGMGGGHPFEAMFGGAGGMPRGGGGGGRGGRAAKPRTVVSEVACTLEELATGVTKKLKITARAFDDSGAPIQRSSAIELEVKPGFHAGTKLTFNNRGDQLQPGGPAGDVQFVIAEKPHQWFKREGADIVYEATVSLKAALTGCKITLKDLYGEEVTLTTDTPVQPGAERRIAGHGMPDRKNGGRKGDLVVRFNVRFPTSIPADKVSALKQALTGL